MLADKPELQRLDDAVVVSTPRGGVQVAVQVAAMLNAQLDIMPVVDLSSPGKPEYVVGAVAENAIHVIDADALNALGVTEDSLARRVAEATAEIARVSKVYRGEEGSALPLAGRTVVVVDDGSTTVPALEAVALALARRNVGRLILATPLSQVSELAGYDELVSVHCSEQMAEIGLWYDDYAAPSDEVAAEIFREHSALRG